MSLYDPPSDPEYTAHACRNCDQDMEKELDGEWICVNKDCEHSPNYESFITKARKAASEWARDLLETKSSEWVILDTETTGLGGYDEVVQVSVIDGEGNILVENLLIKPTISIPESASRIHGISDEAVKAAPRFSDVFSKIYDAVYGKFLVIYNADYDLRILNQSGKALDYPVVFGFSDYDCVMQKYSEWCGEWSDYHGSFRWQRLPGGDHSSLGDCRATLELIKRMASDPT
jgi:DNA polymerase-3 subunit epsilon